jgi:hypothetical protein
VPPIYHTLCRDPSKRWFLPNTFVSDGDEHSRNIEISARVKEAGSAGSSFAPVQVGQGSSFESSDKAIWKKVNFSYLNASFDKDQQAIMNVWDILIEKNWEFDEGITKIVTDLVNSSAKMVGHDMEVTQLSSVFPFDLYNGENLITRSLSRGVVADCFEHSKPGSTLAIVGSPGIGKSWSLIYALQQALLFENSCVVFCFQKDVGKAWVCIRKKNHIYVWYNGSYGFERLRTGLFENGNVLALLDPKEAVDEGGASYSGAWRRLMFAASLNKKHFKNVEKSTPGFEKILQRLGC